MKVKVLLPILNVLLLLVLLPVSAFAGSKDVRISGRKTAIVTTPEVKLGDLASVSSMVPGQDEAVIALKKISIVEAPKPGAFTTLSATKILEVLKAQGVDLTAVGYRLPRVIKVERAGRKVMSSELRAVIEETLNRTSRDVAVKEIDFDQNVRVYPGELVLKARPFSTSRPGEMGFTFKAVSEGEDPIVFDVLARVDEWREIPVARRAINRGSVVEVQDLRMARFNVSDLPRDVALDIESIHGLEIEKNIGVGDVFRRGALVIPPVIEMGAQVTLIYRVGALEATASGVALESGATGDSIKIRNDSSKKVIRGTVLEPGLVGVKK